MTCVFEARSRPQPRGKVIRFEATDPAALDAYRGEVADWLAGQGVRV